MGAQAMPTVVIQEHVLGLEVTVDDVPLVQVLQATDDLGCVEDSAGLRETRLLLIHVVDVEPGGSQDEHSWAG